MITFWIKDLIATCGINNKLGTLTYSKSCPLGFMINIFEIRDFFSFLLLYDDDYD